MNPELNMEFHLLMQSLQVPLVDEHEKQIYFLDDLNELRYEL